MVTPQDRGGAVIGIKKGAAAGELGRVLVFAEEATGDFGMAAVAVFPSHVDGGAFFATGREVHREMGSEGEDRFVVVLEVLHFDFGGESHREFVVEVVDDVRAPVAEHAHAVFVEAAPAKGVVKGIEGELLARAAPEIPVFEGSGHGGLGERIVFLAFIFFHEPEAGSFPSGEFGELIAESEIDHFGEGVDAATGMALVPHLGDDPKFFFGPHQDFRFLEGAGEGLLDVDVLAERHRLNGGGEVGVVGGADRDGIDVLTHLIEHLAEIMEALGIGVAFEIFSNVLWKFEVDIAERNRPRFSSVTK